MNKKEVISILKLLSERLFLPVHIRLAHDGFGCTPGTIGRSIRCTCLGDGEETRWNRTDFIGVLKEECLPQWAAEALSKLTEGKEQSHTQGGMTMQ